MKKIIGITVALVGIGAILLSQHIKNEVEVGKGRVASAQGQVDAGTEVFKVNPFTEEVGKTLTDPAQKKIDEGRRDIVSYEQKAKWLLIGGSILIIVGVGVFMIGKKRK